MSFKSIMHKNDMTFSNQTKSVDEQYLNKCIELLFINYFGP